VWPGGLENPVVFCNVAGVETTQSVMTADASEQSKSNDVEAKHAVSAVADYPVTHKANKAEAYI